MKDRKQATLGQRIVDGLAVFGLYAMAMALCGLAAGTWVSPAWFSKFYGVPETEPFAWVMATGMRDGALGLYAFYLAWSGRNPLPFLTCVLVLPMADAWIVFQASGHLPGAVVHLLGLVQILILMGLVAMSRSRKSEETDA